MTGSSGSVGRGSIGNVFKNMLSLCPTELGGYGKCLAKNASTIDKGVCENEFSALLTCFKKARVRKGPK